MINLEGDIWQRWESKHQDLSAKAKWPLAGLFRGHEGADFRNAAKKVLYTGKATAGPFNLETADQDYFGCNKKAFWSFARKLNSLTGGDPSELGNIAWSNLCKIGTVKGNPTDDLVEEQADLAVKTLRQEWIELRPTLVVCVAEGFQEQLIYRAFDVVQNHDDGFEALTVPGGTFWRRPAIDDMPAFLWMKHPQGKRREYIEAAETIAEGMLA